MTQTKQDITELIDCSCGREIEATDDTIDGRSLEMEKMIRDEYRVRIEIYYLTDPKCRSTGILAILAKSRIQIKNLRKRLVRFES